MGFGWHWSLSLSASEVSLALPFLLIYLHQVSSSHLNASKSDFTYASLRTWLCPGHSTFPSLPLVALHYQLVTQNPPGTCLLCQDTAVCAPLVLHRPLPTPFYSPVSSISTSASTHPVTMHCPSLRTLHSFSVMKEVKSV